MPTKRNILFITTDQMRFDALGCNGGKFAKTPHIDELASKGINYHRAHNQHVVCMPARATIMTGQHVSSHGVWMNGVSMPENTPTIAHWLKDHGYNTALLGKAHFEPWLGRPEDFFENRMALENNNGPHRGFDRMELANHFFEGHSHYDRWMESEHKLEKSKFYPMVTEKGQNTIGAGDTQAPQVWPTDVPRALYHTDWVADRTLNWLEEQQEDTPWFCWMSFPDPHHPWDPPASEISRINWRDLPLPSLYSENREEMRALLSTKPKHWLGYYEGSLWTNLESPREFIPQEMTADQVREINAMTHIENELIDEACGKVIDWLREKGWDKNTDIIFTTDHGEFQGDFGLLFKGPYHVDALMRLPFIWSPAEHNKTPGETVTLPVGHVDLASTFCDIAGIPEPDWTEGKPLPRSDAHAEDQGREFVLTEWDSEHGPIDMHLKSVYHKSGWLCTSYGKSAVYDGDEGELYNMKDDPEQRVNLWNTPAHSTIQQFLLEIIATQFPAPRNPRLERLAPV